MGVLQFFEDYSFSDFEQNATGIFKFLNMTTKIIKSDKGDDSGSCNSANFSNFSIDHILNTAGENSKRNNVGHFDGNMYADVKFSLDHFSWLQCTRYCPPKIPRNQRKDAPQKRQMGRHPRIPFTSHQLYILEEKFQQTPYLTGEEVNELAKKLQLADIRVKIWFQNRRARDRREKFTLETPSQSSLTSSTPSTTNLSNLQGKSVSEKLKLSASLDKNERS